MEGIEPGILVLLALAGLAAGFVDAVVGGGGLIQLPALLLGLPGASPVQLLATNKLGSICGTTVSSITYFRRVRPDLRTAFPLAGAAFIGSLGGASVAFWFSKEMFNPIILAVLLVVGGYTLARPTMGQLQRLRFGRVGKRHLAVAVVIGLLVGSYDGALGPGTGSFFVFALVSALGYGFLEASAKAKIANLATNLAALVVFVPAGAVLWEVGLVMGACNIVGGYLGARVAVARGSRFVRLFFVLVVSAFVLVIGWETLQQFS
ncbi:TSUP family transporter [Ornithinimicrobium pratense]|uniref:Probable membrane transporter protein n=1 Tax=Ornithinimicrobium pratense TaxID=2593973 RepID=A0A5J6V779_9MICO|nr:TSUP family transporter [Ornithinimicrobium pratense]QFG68933.1 TSUP family transporter [Ornithinimicrobium pratense]